MGEKEEKQVAREERNLDVRDNPRKNDQIINDILDKISLSGSVLIFKGAADLASDSTLLENKEILTLLQSENRQIRFG